MCPEQTVTHLSERSNKAGHAGHSRFYARGGGERSEQIALRSRDPHFLLGHLHLRGQGVEAFATIPAAVDPDTLAGVRANFCTVAGVIACRPTLSAIAWARSAPAWA